MSGEVAIVTGAGSGIGAGVAKTLAARGAAVVLIDRNASAVQRVCDAIQDSGGRSCAAIADVTVSSQLDSAVQRGFAEFGRPTTAVACAGIAAVGRVTDMPESVVDQILAVNVKGVYLLARAAMPHLEQGGGSFIAIASDAALLGGQGYAAYCASKHAVVGLIKALALDHGPHRVRSNAVCPGYVETPMLDRLLEELSVDRTSLQRQVPLERLARVEDVANAVAYLSSPAGSYANGTVLSIDGGTTAGPFSATPPCRPEAK